MEYSKPIHEVTESICKAGREIYRNAMTGEQCAKLFEQLDRSDPDIHEMVDRIQSANGNDRYSCMMQVIESAGVSPPFGFYRTPIKDDRPGYVFDNGNVRRRGRGW